MADMMIALKRASDGSADQMIAVRKGLLAEAYARIVELEAVDGFLNALSTTVAVQDNADTKAHKGKAKG